MDFRLPGSSVHEILQARILKWVAIHFSRGSSQPRDQIHICIVGRFFVVWDARKALVFQYSTLKSIEVQYNSWCFWAIPAILPLLLHLLLDNLGWKYRYCTSYSIQYCKLKYTKTPHCSGCTRDSVHQTRDLMWLNIRTQVHIFESSHLEGSYVGDLRGLHFSLRFRVAWCIFLCNRAITSSDLYSDLL